MTDTINIKIFYEEKFTVIPKRWGEDGRCAVVKDFDRDLLSWFDLKELMKEEVGYKQGDKIYYLSPITIPPNGLVEIESDKACMELLEAHKNDKWCTFLVVPENQELVVDEAEAYDSDDNVEDENYICTNVVDSSTGDSDGYEEELTETGKGRKKDCKAKRKLLRDEPEVARFEGDSDEELFPFMQVEAGHLDLAQANAKGKEVATQYLHCSPRAKRAAKRNMIKEAAGSQGAISKAVRQKKARAYKEASGLRAKRGAGEAHNAADEGAMSDSPSEGFITPPRSPSEEAILVSRSRGLNQVWFDATNIKKPNIEMGMLFSTGRQFRDAVRNLCIQSGRGCMMVKNDRLQISARCRDSACTWYIYASKIPDEPTFKVKKIQPIHSCGARFKCEQVTAEWLSENYQEHLRSDPKWNANAFKATILRDHQIEVNKCMVYRAKRKASKLIEGEHAEQYKRISDYADTVLKLNPNSKIFLKLHVSLMTDVKPRFERLYFCFSAQISGFLTGCRPFICLDGCFVKLDNGAQILQATARDGNNNILPLAFCVAESECYQSWHWFLEKLRDSIGIGNDVPWTFMSDRQKGLLNAVQEVFPDADHRFCIRHIHSNFSNAGFRGKEFKAAMEKPAYAYTMGEFDAAMEELKKLSAAAYNYMAKIDKKHWARHAFTSRAKTDLLVNNQGESFNSSILEARDKPIISMMEHIRTWLMQKFAKKREGVMIAKWEITPSCRKKLELEKSDSRLCVPVCAGRGIWQVSALGRTYVVDVNQKTCGCYKWDLTGIPCAHAISAIHRSNLRPEDFVCSYFKRDAYVNAYDGMIFPVPDKSQWETSSKPDVDPPLFKKQPGRPKKNRRRGADEPAVPLGRQSKVSTRCSNCRELGHNYRSCKKPIRPDWKARGTKKSIQGSQASSSTPQVQIIPSQLGAGSSTHPTQSYQVITGSSSIPMQPPQAEPIWTNNSHGVGLYYPSWD